MKTVAIIAARMGSTRAPGKVMRQLGDMPLIGWVVRAAMAATGIDEVYVATTEEPRDDIIVHWCNQHKIEVWRGSETDVLKRFYDCALMAEADVIVRLTGDCAFLDPDVISDVILLRKRLGVDFASNVEPPTWPDGLDVECFTMQALSAAHHEAALLSDRDCLTQFITRNSHRFSSANLRCPIPGLQDERWVLDTPEDFEFATRLCEELLSRYLWPPRYRGILGILDAKPELREINKQSKRNERFFLTRAAEELPARTFGQSSQLLHRALKVQPYGASTYSKSKVAWGGDSPLYGTHGDGGLCYDCDGNSYVDFCGALGAVILGYRNPQVDQAIRDQLDKCISLSFASDLEYRVCQCLASLPAGDNMVVLGKNGTDATTAALRIARAYTGREYVLVFAGAYHGFADWSLGDTERGYGIPPVPRRVVCDFKHYDIALEGRLTEGRLLAAVIVEPDRYPNWQLRSLQKQCQERGTLLIFDEVFTGMRYPNLLASRSEHVHPDLTCVGKSIANGMPLSALIGDRKIMERFAPGDRTNAFYSTTMGGETLSLAACLATLDQLQAGGSEQIQRTADYIDILVRDQSHHFGLQKRITSSGAPLNRLNFDIPELANQYRHEMAQAGVLIYSAFNVMAAHSDDDLTRLEAANYQALKRIANGSATGYQVEPNKIMRR